MDVSRFDKRRLFVACCALGFASFKVAQSSLYSTAMLTSETTTVLIAGLDFSIASAAFVVLTEAVIVALALLGRLPRLSMPVIAPSLVLAATAVLSYSGALSSVDPAVSLMALAFAQGTATVMLTLAWVEIMTQMEPTISMKTLASSMLLAAAVTLALQNSPSLVMLPCVVATLVASALLYRRAKGIAGNALASGKTMGGDEVAAGAEQKRDRTSLRPYLRGFVSIGEGLLSLLVLGCVVGIINGFMVVQHYDFDGSSLASAMGIAAASMAFFVMAYGFPKTFSASRAYRALFPLLTGVLIIWPFANFQYSYFVGAAFVAGHSLISTSVMYLIIREAHESDLNPYAFMGASVLLISVVPAFHRPAIHAAHQEALGTRATAGRVRRARPKRRRIRRQRHRSDGSAWPDGPRIGNPPTAGSRQELHLYRRGSVPVSQHRARTYQEHLREAGRTLQAGDNRPVHRLTSTKMS